MLYSAPFCGADILNVVKIDAVFGTKEHVGFGGPRPQVRNGRPEKVMPSEDAAIFMLNSPGRRREFCHFDDTPFCFPIETPTKGRGGVQQSGSLADGWTRRTGRSSWPSGR